MKTKMSTTAILSMLALVGSMGITAQERPYRSPREGQKPPKEMLAPEKQAALQTKKLTLKLDLDSKQQAAVEKLFLEAAKQRKQSIEKGGNKKAQTKEVGYERRMKMLDNQIEHKAAMKKILQPEQFKKWEKSIITMGKKHKRGFKGHGQHNPKEGV